MILDTVRTSSIEGNMPIRSKRKMTISEEGADILMDNLSNLYNDPLLAVIREYYANGYDSHKKAGVTRAVEVTLPSIYQPSYIVRDYGTGMSEEFINDVYSIYGESTKRKEATTIGAFGLGSKSGFAIAEQFTVTSFHEGKKISVLFQKGEEGSFDAIVVSVLETDESNGVIVTVPIDKDSINTFVDRAEEFFKYVDPGSVLVNGKEPEHALAEEDINTIEEGDIKVAFKLTASGYGGQVRFVMGGIPYHINSTEVNDSLIRTGNSNVYWGGMDINFVVPLGSFNLTGNREGVRATPKTKALLDRATTIYAKGIYKAAQKAVGAATDYREALYLWDDWQRYCKKNLTWKGKAFSYVASTKQRTDDVDAQMMFLSVQDSSYGGPRTHYKNRADFRTPATIVLGRTPEDFEKSNVRHARIYLRNLNTKASTLHVMEKLEDYFTDLDIPRFLENSQISVVQYDDFRNEVRQFEAKRRAEAKALRLANGPVQKAAPKPKPQFPVLDLTTRSVEWVEADKITETDTAYLSSRDMTTPFDPSYGPRRIVTSYISKNDTKYHKSPVNLANALSSVTDARFIVLLSGAKTPKSLKKHSGKDIPNVTKEITKKAEECVEKADNTSVAKLNASETKEVKKLRRDLASEYVNRIEDPDLKGIILQDEQVAEESPALLDAVSYLNLVGINAYNLRNQIKAKAVLITPQDEGSQFNFVQRYPLIAILQTDAWFTKAEQFEDVIEYLNTKYRAAQVLTATS